VGCTPPKTSLFDRSIAESFERESSQSSRGHRFRSGCAELRKRRSRPGFEPFPLCAREPAFLRRGNWHGHVSKPPPHGALRFQTVHLSYGHAWGGPRPRHTRAPVRNTRSVPDRAVQRGRHDVEKSKQYPAKLFCFLSPKYAKNHLLLCLKEGVPRTRDSMSGAVIDDAWIGRKPQACKSRLLHPAKAPKHPGSLRESNWCLTCDRPKANYG